MNTGLKYHCSKCHHEFKVDEVVAVDGRGVIKNVEATSHILHHLGKLVHYLCPKCKNYCNFISYTGNLIALVAMGVEAHRYG